MPPFAGDLLDPGRSHADLLLQVEADTAESTVAESARTLAGLDAMSIDWQAAGTRPGNHIDQSKPLMRNSFGFIEGHGNHDPRDGRAVDAMTLIRAGANVPAWAVGGTYAVLRVIRLARTLWDTEPVATQERIIGRHIDGSWLDGTPPNGTPDFSADPHGQITPLDSHVRRADPRARGSIRPPLIRRSWTYQAAAAGGTPEDGILFLCYQADIGAGFEAVQRRLRGQILDDYMLTVGGGYFVFPPPDTDATRWDRRLLT